MRVSVIVAGHAAKIEHVHKLAPDHMQGTIYVKPGQLFQVKVADLRTLPRGCTSIGSVAHDLHIDSRLYATALYHQNCTARR